MNKKPQLCVIRCVLFQSKLYLRTNYFRGAFLSRKERNDLDKQGMEILRQKGINHSKNENFNYENESYDKLRQVLESKSET